MRKALKILLILVAVYFFLFIGLFTSMCQRPEVFNSVMAKTPNLVFFIFPFKSMWLHARDGKLRVSDEAPDFFLETYDKKTKVQLSAFRGKKPVVLVFGSYT
ncbi:MAG: hypothetical protein AB1489_09080 [Acidobacteriota bacterium]